MQHSIDICRFSWIRRLAVDYVFNYNSLAPFFAGDPSAPEAWQKAITRRLTLRPPSAFVDVLATQQQSRGAPSEALAATESLRRPDTLAVVTGQQAGLFGGPLFTLLKAVTAIKLARRLSQEQSVPVVAVFWVDAEDHDWNEVASCAVLDTGWQVKRVALEPPLGAGEMPVGSLKLGDNIRASVEAMASALPPNEFTATIINDLRRTYQSGTSMSKAFSLWLETVLGAEGLILFDSSDPAAKPFVKNLFEQELRHTQTAALAAEAGTQLVARGYHAQVTPHPESVALFRVDGVRQSIRRNNNSFTVGNAQVTLDDLLKALDRHPEQFSPNVLLRPLVQDTLFPTVCYVPGPNELAYLAQLKNIYERFEVPMPLIYPRDSATLLDSAAARFLKRNKLSLEVLQPQDEAILNQLLKAQLPEAVKQSVDEAQRALQARIETIIRAVPTVDPTLAGAARSTLGRMEHDLTALHKKILKAAKRNDSTLRRQFMCTQTQAFPEGRPQERVLGFVGFLNRFGPKLVDRLLTELPLDPKHHALITP